MLRLQSRVAGRAGWQGNMEFKLFDIADKFVFQNDSIVLLDNDE
jgi:hypothetical protein